MGTAGQQKYLWLPSHVKRYSSMCREAVQTASTPQLSTSPYCIHRLVMMVNAAGSSRMDGKVPTLLPPCRNAEDRGKLIHDTIGPGLQLMHQNVRVGQLSLTLVVPADVDAVMDMYIDRGK